MRRPPEDRPGAPRPSPRRCGVLLAACLALPCLAQPAPEPAADAPGPGTAELDPETAALVRGEQIRTAILDAFDRVNVAGQTREESQAEFDAALARVTAFGEDVIPYLTPEIESPNAYTFFFAATVLGHVGGEEAIRVLRAALEQAERSPGKFALYRKAWCAVSLALAGLPEAVELVDSGEKQAGNLEVYARMSALEVAAGLTAPESVPPLLARLDRVLEQAEDELLAARLLKAVRRTGDPRAIARCRELLDHDSWRVRLVCVDAVRRAADPADLPRMTARADDLDQQVRGVVVEYLRDLADPRSRETVLARLELEESPAVRALLYQAVANVMGERALPVLRLYRKRENYLERMRLARAVGSLRDPKGANLLRELLRDDSPMVRTSAARALGQIPGAGPRETLLATLRNSAFAVVEAAIAELDRLGDRRALPRIADLLVNHALPNHAMTAQARHRLEVLGEALVAQGYTEVTGDLRKFIGRVGDPIADGALKSIVRRLETIAERGTDVERWAELLRGEDAELRTLAGRRLGRLGGDAAADALVAAFDGADPEGREQIVESLSRLGSARAEGLARRLLADPEFDPAVSHHLRDHGAWLARRIGTPAMVDALRESALRRQGRDYPVLVYLSALAGPEALPVLKQVFRERLRHLDWHRSYEQDELLWIMGRLSHGRDVERLDVEPHGLEFGD